MANIWDPAIVMKEELVKEILKEQFPEITIKEIKKIGEGFDNTVFRLNNEILLRFPRREIAVSILNVERKLLPRIYNQFEMTTTVPKIIGKPSELFPWPFLGYNFISGKPPIRLTRNERILMIEPIAKFLKKLHSIKLDELKDLDLPHDKLRRLDINFRKPQLEKYVQQAIQKKLIVDVQKINHYTENLVEIKSESPLVLVHGDLHFKNMIVNEQNQLEGIIDWGDAHIGNFELDLSIIYSLIPIDQRESFYQHYGQVSDASKRLAQFKAIYTTIVLMLFAKDQNDFSLVSFCQDNLKNALTGW
ncbi:phosphotransferase [Bacillus sp. AFS041924]|uniref:phosphotransferase n=1 Tax=Bacillus sp. AFS041924 TaxID=2033503 RepID=UPI000BFDB16B|nr:phosphotransferase [Bacillus sp. AFS041924]PGS47540.1 phosphotransferase [Bacillus sp. AFS041924]